MSNNYLSTDGFQKWLKNDQSENHDREIIGKKIYSKLKFSDLLEAIETYDSNCDEYEIAKCFRKNGGKIIEVSTEGLLTVETKKGKFFIEKVNTKKHQSH